MFAFIRSSIRLSYAGFALSLFCGPSSAQQAAAPNDPHGHVGPVHLVGHEETALLQRVQDLIDDWDPRKLTNPYVKTHVRQLPSGKVVEKLLKRPDLAEFIADVEAAEVLGKAFVWDMQAGSDFQRTADGKYIGTACATCHYSAGADARTRGVMRIPTVVWDKYDLAPKHPLEFGEKQREYDVRLEATKLLQPSLFPKGTPFSLIVGSHGVAPNRFEKLNGRPTPGTGPWNSEEFTERRVNSGKEQWEMFVSGSFRSRQITHRNSPSIVNSGFSNRLFHDGRAESTFNGFSIFGDADPREVIHRRRDFAKRDASGNVILKSDGSPEMDHDIIHVPVAITNAALASQAVGPIVNDVEMSYSGREFPNVARKLLDAEILDFQDIDTTDSLFAPFDARIVREQLGCGVEKDKLKRFVGADRNSMTYRELIQRAFRKEWWDSDKKVELILLKSSEKDGNPEGELMEANFSLFWGLSILLYEASLVSNQSPFDDMMQGSNTLVEKKWEDNKQRLGAIHLDRFPRETQPEHKTGTAVFQHGFRVFMNQGCIECHSGPLLSEIYDRKMEIEKSPIHYKVERVLFPNSQSDSIAIAKQESHSLILGKIASLIRTNHPELVRDAESIALELDLQREIAAGNHPKLTSGVKEYLKPFKLTAELAEHISKLLLEFDRRSKMPFGNRLFFGEVERVNQAEAISEPVLVERMVIPPKLQQFRRPFPLADNPIANTYAFYDLGFYNLGVSPPRYDDGIGAFFLEEVDPIEKASKELKDSTADKNQKLGMRLQNGLQKARATNPKDNQAIDKPAQVLDQILNDSELQFTEQDKNEIRSVVAKLARSDKRPTATPGSAYQFRSDWYGDRFKSKMKSTPRMEEAVLPPSQQAPNAIEPTRTSSQGPKEDASQNRTVDQVDKSWDRDGLPEDTRRSQLYFISRARRLVANELKWGFRKPFSHDNELAFWGAFKTPTLRNVELTAPYMHNGRLLSLSDVISFYEHDVDDDDNDDDNKERVKKPQHWPNHRKVLFVPRDRQSNPDKHPAIVPLDFTRDDRLALEFFLICLTDDRVKYERAPFDHPSIEIVDGYVDESGMPKESIKHVNATGEHGRK